jgi:hypothetical protein
VREEAEVNAMLAVSTIKGGIRVGKAKEGKANEAAATDSASDEREPVLAGKG